MTNKDQKLRKLLKDNLVLLEKAKISFHLSIEKCLAIGLKEDYTFEELESFDSLTSKFARTSDIFTQKVLKTIFSLLRENTISFIDRANLAEKLGLVKSADELIEIRDMRNSIAHEYLMENLLEIFRDVLQLSRPLLEAIDLSIKFCKSHNW